MKFIRFIGITFCIAMVGFVLGVLLFMAGYYQLWWSFPSSWEPVRNLPDVPQDLLALNAEESNYLLRLANGDLYSCHEQSCALEIADWTTTNTQCDTSTRPASIALFPYLVSRQIRVNLACERSYTDIARTVFVISTKNKHVYYLGSISLVPVDAGLVVVTLLGGISGALAGLILSGLFLLSRFIRMRTVRARDDKNVT